MDEQLWVTDPNEPPPTILLVDDTPVIRQFLRALLEGMPCRILEAANGREALRIVQDERPTLVLMDVEMPEMGGLEACRRMKDDPATADIPVLMVTVLSEPENVLKGFRAGAVDYLTKPIQPEELLARVGVHLELQRRIRAEQHLVQELKSALAHVKVLAGLIPICAGCKKIRDDRGFWQQVEEYISNHSDAVFTHGLCPDCIRKYFGDLPPA